MNFTSSLLHLFVVVTCIISRHCTIASVDIRSTDDDKGNITISPLSVFGKNGTIISLKAHVTYTSLHESHVSSIDEVLYFDSALILAFDQSIKKTSNNFNDDPLRMINAKVIGQEKFTKPVDVGKNGKHRNLRFRNRFNSFYKYDYSLFLDFRCNLCGDKSGFWDRRRRYLRKSKDFHLDTLRELSVVIGGKFCKMLRDSSYIPFQDIKNCHIKFE